ncbi:MAG TPA: protein kinase [Pyrinomonadaceae bacterium]|nr:protein kinase [Pyrinomonadaceae bacterium]
MCTEAGHPPLSETHAGGRELVEGYSLDMLVESGLRGEVFKAHQIATNASCIIRLITTSEKERERIVREAKVAGAIFHPNVADVFDAGTVETGQVYVVSEYPEGQTLRELLNKVHVPEILTAIQILSQTAEALHTLHQNGITHNAVRPENIVLTSDPDNQLLVRVQNIDHGGVAFRSVVSNKFLIDSALDSLRYFAPEQCTGESAGPQTDVYSLGIVFYEMLSGSPPFDASTATALIHKQRNERPPDVRIANFQLRMLLTHTLMESLQKQPSYRPASADKFGRQMRHMEQLATHVSTPPPAVAVPETTSKVAPAIVASPAPSRPMPVVINVPDPAPEPVQDFESASMWFDEGVSEPVPIVKPAPLAVKQEPVVEQPLVVKEEPVIEQPLVVKQEALVEQPLVVKQEPVVEQPLDVEPTRVSPAVLLADLVADPQPIMQQPPLHDVVSLEDSIPDPLPIVEQEPVADVFSWADAIPDPLPVVEVEPTLIADLSTDTFDRAVTLADSNADPVSIAVSEPVLQVPSSPPPETVDLSREESNGTPRRSRLKTWKKKLHAMSAAVSQVPRIEKATNTADTPEIVKVDTPPELVITQAPVETTTDLPVEIANVDTPVHAEPVSTLVTMLFEEPNVIAAAESAKDDPPAILPNFEIPIELTTLELPAEMTGEATGRISGAVRKTSASAKGIPADAPSKVTDVETRQTKATGTPVRRKTTKRSATPAKAPAVDASIKQVAPRPLKADAVAPEKLPVAPPEVVTRPEPITMEPPSLVVEERVVRVAPKKVQWIQLEDDIPSESDVLDALVKDGLIDESEKYTGHVFTVSSPKSADGPVAAAAVNPPPPPPVVPAKSADGPVRSVAQASPSQNPQSAKTQKPAAAKKPAAVTTAARETITRRAAPSSVVDQEEITLVRPPRQIRIDIDPRSRQTAWIPPRPTPESDFFPTLLGDTSKPAHIPMPPTDAMFSTYYSAPVKKTAIPYRTVMFGGGVLVLVVTFLIGDGFVGDHVQSKNESVASRTTTAPRAKKVPPISAKTETVVEETELKALPDNDRLTRTIADKPASVEKTATVEKTAAVKKDTPKSTTRDNAPSARSVSKPATTDSKVTREPVQQPRVLGVKSSPPQTNPNIATRPRIVKVPK